MEAKRHYTGLITAMIKSVNLKAKMHHHAATAAIFLKLKKDDAFWPFLWMFLQIALIGLLEALLLNVKIWNVVAEPHTARLDCHEISNSNLTISTNHSN